MKSCCCTLRIDSGTKRTCTGEALQETMYTLVYTWIFLSVELALMLQVLGDVLSVEHMPMFEVLIFAYLLSRKKTIWKTNTF